MNTRPSVKSAARAAALILTFASEGIAFAQASPHEAAAADFEAGNTLMDKGRCSEAIPKYRSSVAKEENVGTYLNLGTCLEQTGATDQALFTFRSAERVARERNDTTRLEKAAAASERVRGKLLRLVFVLPKDGEGTVVRVNGRELTKDERDDLAAFVLPGSTLIEAESRRGEKFRVTVVGSPGESRNVAVAFEEAPQPEEKPAVVAPVVAAPPKAEQPPSKSGSGILPYVFLGGGVVLLGVSTAFWLKTKSDVDDRDAACPNATCTRGTPEFDTALEAHNTAKTDQTIAIATTAGGIVAVGVGVVLLITSPKKQSAFLPIVAPARGMSGFVLRY